MAFRYEHPGVASAQMVPGQSIHGLACNDILWFNPDGGEMTGGAMAWRRLGQGHWDFLNGEKSHGNRRAASG